MHMYNNREFFYGNTGPSAVADEISYATPVLSYRERNAINIEYITEVSSLPSEPFRLSMNFLQR